MQTTRDRSSIEDMKVIKRGAGPLAKEASFDRYHRRQLYGHAAANYSAHPRRIKGCGWESLMKSVTLGNVTMSHRTREMPAECPCVSLHSTMIGLPRAALEN
ncbi:hypothetical protein EVAR_49114_1 [Eumeta japonica]|uniref:Uncharacterized protein n=1 Tax=Eumeta variegata TaxID=151549 RepID=A0A4C1YKU8_EUMVA|nr:hypothetical protein EVAR_49114_1 [Eumeta japonica]